MVIFGDFNTTEKSCTDSLLVSFDKNKMNKERFVLVWPVEYNKQTNTHLYMDTINVKSLILMKAFGTTKWNWHRLLASFTKPNICFVGSLENHFCT